MEVSRQALLDLLELQRVDSVIDRLEARRRDLPEQKELDALQERLEALEGAIAAQEAVVAEVAARQKKLDHDIELLTMKTKAEEEKLYSGTVANPKELAGIHREIESLKRRISGMEDTDLEVMEERESAEGDLARLQEEASALRREMAAAAARRDSALGETAGQLEEARAERGQWAPRIDPSLLGLYQELRVEKDGVAAAALAGGVCQGCHMRLPAQELERVRKAEGIVRCEECRRILVVV